MMASRGGWRRRVRLCGDLRFCVGLAVVVLELEVMWFAPFVLFFIVCFGCLARSFLDTPTIYLFFCSHGSAFLSPYKLGRSMHLSAITTNFHLA